MATPAESLLRLSRAPTALAAALAMSLAGCTDDASPPYRSGGWGLRRVRHSFRGGAARVPSRECR
jgi:hypothetical protein